MNDRSHILAICCFLLVGFANGQVVLDKAIVLSGPDQIDKQLTGLPLSSSPSVVLTAGVEQAGAYRTASPEQAINWVVDLASLDGELVAGTHLVLIAPQPSGAAIGLVVNGQGPFELITGTGVPLDAASVIPGTALSVIFDGTAFQLMNGKNYSRRPCPEGMIGVDQQYCIDIDQQPQSDFFAAATTCANNGKRLCGWGEFLVACQNAAQLGMLNPMDNWEWTGDASNENGSARVVGAGSCFSAGNALVSASLDRGVRCCYTR